MLKTWMKEATAAKKLMRSISGIHSLKPSMLPSQHCAAANNPGLYHTLRAHRAHCILLTCLHILALLNCELLEVLETLSSSHGLPQVSCTPKKRWVTVAYNQGVGIEAQHSLLTTTKNQK